MTDQAEIHLKSRIGTLLSSRAATVAFAVGITLVALYVLHRFSADVPWQDVKSDIAGYSAGRIALAACFAALSYVALASYDVLAVEIAAPGRVPRPVAAMAGAGGYAMSNMLGLSWLTGGALRFRIYSGFGLDWTVVAAVIATSWVSMWLGITLLLGAVLVLRPEGLATAVGLSPIVDALLGTLLLVAVAGFFVWLALGRRSIEIAGVRLKLPTVPIAAAQTATGVFDILGAALTLYILLPDDLGRNFALFFIVYVSAVGLGILSHAPGGIGVLEATVVAGLGANGRSDVIAALALYRVVYYLGPFAITLVAMAFAYLVARRRRLAIWANVVRDVLRPVVPVIVAGVALISGATLLASGSLPAETGRLQTIRTILPLPLVEASHLFGSVAGVLLLVVANALIRKQRRAWIAACVLTVIGLLASVSKGLDWEEALLLLVALAILAIFRSAFYRVGTASIFRIDWRWLVASAVLISASIWIGLFANSHVPYRGDLWWHFAWSGDAPRYLRASLAVAVLFSAVALNSLLSARPRRLLPEPIPEGVRNLVAASPRAEAWLALTGDKRFLISDDGRAFIAYADTGRSLIARGDPVGDHDAGEEVIWRLRELADRLGRRCAFYAVSQDFLPAYLDMGMSILKIGEVARVNLSAFTLDGASNKDLRQARSRAAREGYQVDIVKAEDLDTVLPALRAISDAWLASKQGEEKHFALGAFTEEYLRNFDCAVLRHGATGRIVAFANLLQGAGQHELSVDLMRHVPDGPKYAMDALFASLLVWGRAQGFAWFSLGAAPLAGLPDHPLATTWNRLGSFIYRHGDHLYHFEGLREFKQKFAPSWSPNFLASHRGLKAPLVLLEVNALISGGIRGLLK